MRIKRLKQYRKYANLFKMNHGFESPYKFLVDGSFLQMAVKTNTKLKESFGRVFQDTVHWVITRWIISELESMGPAVQKAVNTTKTFTIEECNHSDTLPADEWIKSLIGDRNIVNIFLNHFRVRTNHGFKLFFLIISKNKECKK